MACSLDADGWICVMGVGGDAMLAYIKLNKTNVQIFGQLPHGISRSCSHKIMPN